MSRTINYEGRMYRIEEAEMHPCEKCIIKNVDNCFCSAVKLDVPEYVAEDLGEATPTDGQIGKIVDLFKESRTKGEQNYIDYIKNHWNDERLLQNNNGCEG